MNMIRFFQVVFKRPAFIAAFLVSALFFYGCSSEDKKTKTPPASAVTESVVAKMNQAKAHFDKAIEHLRAEDIDAAIEEYVLSLNINPHSAEANSNLGFAYLDKWDFERALEYQGKALQINSNFANAYYGLALVHEKKGDKVEAAKNWKEFIKRSQPGSKWALRAKERLDALK